MFKLRNYQKNSLNKLNATLKDKRQVCLTLPTGGGKTIMMIEWARKKALKGLTTVIVVNREELVTQTLEKCPDASVMKAGRDGFNGDALIHIIMLQTAHRRQKQLFDIKADYVLFDEIHDYYDGMMFAQLCDVFSSAKIVGISATPINNKGYLLEGFEDVVNEAQVQDLIKDGWLVKPTYYTPADYNLDLSFCKMTGGDYDIADLDEIMMNVDKASKIYEGWDLYARFRKTIAFCSSIRQAEFLNDYFVKRGIKSGVLHSESNNREEMIGGLRNGELSILFNVGILIAGFDEPSVDCILFANPTKVLRRYLQQAGRGLRPYPNKTDCLMLDFADVTRQHGQCDDLRYFRPKQKEVLECNLKQCPECGAIVTKTIKQCPYCGYEFGEVADGEIKGAAAKKEIERLEKAMNMQVELKEQIAELTAERGYKSGYRWFLFVNTLKSKRPTESSVQFFKRKLAKIKKIKDRGWKPAALQFN